MTFPLRKVIFGVISCSLLAAGLANAQISNLWSEIEAEEFCRGLHPVSTTELSQSFGAYFDYFKQNEDISVDKILKLEIQDVISLLDRAVELDLGIMNIITDESFLKNSSCVLFFGNELLQQIDESYNLHLLWMINTVPVTRNTELKMSHLVFGGGKLIIGYPESREVSVREYRVWPSDDYIYPYYLTVDIENNQERRGLTNIRTLNTPAGELEYFKGPLRSSIFNILLLSDDSLSADHSLLGSPRQFDNIHIEYRQ